MSYLPGFQAQNHRPGPDFRIVHAIGFRIASSTASSQQRRTIWPHHRRIGGAWLRSMFKNSIQLSLHHQSLIRFRLATFSKCQPRSLHLHHLIRLSLRRLPATRITRRPLLTFSVSEQPSLKIYFFRRDWRNSQRNGVSQARGESA